MYRAGPGMMLVDLPVSRAEETIVTLDYSLGALRGSGVGITMLTCVVLGALLVDGLLLGGRVRRRLAHRVWRSRRKERPRGWVEWGTRSEVNAGVSPSVNAGEQDLVSPIESTSSTGDSIVGSRPRELVEAGDPSDVEAVCQQFVEPQKSSGNEDGQAEWMIEQWRRARQRDDHED